MQIHRRMSYFSMLDYQKRIPKKNTFVRKSESVVLAWPQGCAMACRIWVKNKSQPWDQGVSMWITLFAFRQWERFKSANQPCKRGEGTCQNTTNFQTIDNQPISNKLFAIVIFFKNWQGKGKKLKGRCRHSEPLLSGLAMQDGDELQCSSELVELQLNHIPESAAEIPYYSGPVQVGATLF